MAAGVRGGQVSNEMRATVRCFGCGVAVPDIEGPTHRYMLSAPGCWARYGRPQAGGYPMGHSVVSPPLVSLASHRGAPPSFPTVKQVQPEDAGQDVLRPGGASADRKSTRLNSSHVRISYAAFCLKKK